MCGSGGCVDVYGTESYFFYDTNFNKVTIGETIKVLLSNTDYGAWFEEDLDCKRLK